MLKVDLSGILDLAEDFRRRVRQASLASLLAVESLAVEEASHRSGNLINAISTAQDADGVSGVVFVSGAAPYAQYVHEGTGLFGPRKERTRPREKKALFWAGAQHPVRSVAGQKPNPFMDRACVRGQDVVLGIFEEALS